MLEYSQGGKRPVRGFYSGETQMERVNILKQTDIFSNKKKKNKKKKKKQTTKTRKRQKKIKQTKKKKNNT